ncbi:MAG: hypothetical protein JWP69_1394 [Flaviaesturariibacter sp.]|nr:hypothetical protein [Flaviaesturariibacter sp.]
MRSSVLFILMLFLSCLAGLAQQTSFTASVDKSRIVIGEPFKLLLKGTAPGAVSKKWTSIDTFPYFEILETSKVDTVKNGSALVLQQTLTLTSWDSGRSQIPSFSFAGARSKPIVITVSFAPFNSAQEYHDIKEIIDVEKPPRTVWYWYVALGLLLIGLMTLLFPSRKQQPITEPKPDETVFKKTIQQLEGLRSKRETSEAKEFYTELILILRNYLYKRKGIGSFSKTTEDLVQGLPVLKLKRDQEVAFIQSLQESDMVKFAQGQPALAQRERDLATIKAAIIAIEEN